MDKLPTQLKKARLKKGLSQQEAADKLQVTRQSISSWENGHSRPDLYNLKLLSHTYEVPLDKLVKDNHYLDLQIESDREEFLRIFDLLQQRELERVQKIETYLLILIVVIGLIPILGLITSTYAVCQQSYKLTHHKYHWLPAAVLTGSLLINGLLAYSAVVHRWLNLTWY